MFRDLLLAIVIVAIVGVALFYGVSGFSYITLVFAALALSVLFVRRPASPGGDIESSEREGSVRPFARPAGSPRGSAGSASSTRRYGAGPIQSSG